MLFLLHLAHKMRAPEDGGGRVGIVMNGSPLFNGAAESGPSNIRKWLLENDLVEAIVALPTNMFFNTGIATYIWILDNTKHPDRKGKVQLIDATSFWTKMRKNLGAKNREVSDADRDKILSLYAAFDEADPDYSKVFATTSSATGRSPSNARFSTSPASRSSTARASPSRTPRSGTPRTSRSPTAARRRCGRQRRDRGLLRCRGSRTSPTPGSTGKKTGYEIPFTRHFYKYVPPRPLAEIDADLEKQVAKILDLLREVSQ